MEVRSESLGMGDGEEGDGLMEWIETTLELMLEMEVEDGEKILEEVEKNYGEGVVIGLIQRNLFVYWLTVRDEGVAWQINEKGLVIDGREVLITRWGAPLTLVRVKGVPSPIGERMIRRRLGDYGLVRRIDKVRRYKKYPEVGDGSWLCIMEMEEEMPNRMEWGPFSVWIETTGLKGRCQVEDRYGYECWSEEEREDMDMKVRKGQKWIKRKRDRREGGIRKKERQKELMRDRLSEKGRKVEERKLNWGELVEKDEEKNLGNEGGDTSQLWRIELEEEEKKKVKLKDLKKDMGQDKRKKDINGKGQEQGNDSMIEKQDGEKRWSAMDIETYMDMNDMGKEQLRVKEKLSLKKWDLDLDLDMI